MASVGRNRGFTLIELMIVVVVVAILAAVAYPSYQNYIRKANRADAHQALLRVQLEQEKWRANNVAFTTEVGPTGLRLATTAGRCYASNEGNYQVCVTQDPAPTAVRFRAEATGQGRQASDTGCPTIWLEINAGVETRGPSANCW